MYEYINADWSQIKLTNYANEEIKPKETIYSSDSWNEDFGIIKSGDRLVETYKNGKININ